MLRNLDFSDSCLKPVLGQNSVDLIMASKENPSVTQSWR